MLPPLYHRPQHRQHGSDPLLEGSEQECPVRVVGPLLLTSELEFKTELTRTILRHELVNWGPSLQWYR